MTVYENDTFIILVLIFKLFRFYSTPSCDIMTLVNAFHDIQRFKEEKRQNNIPLLASSLTQMLFSTTSKRLTIILLIIILLVIYIVYGSKGEQIDISKINTSLVPSAAFESSLTPTTSAVPIIPTIILITPTNKRPERLAEMTRLSQTLMHIKNIYWIVIEDGTHTVDAVNRLLKRSGIPYVYFPVRTKPGFPGMFTSSILILISLLIMSQHIL